MQKVRVLVLCVVFSLLSAGCVHQSPRPMTELSVDLTGEWFWEHPAGAAQMHFYLARSELGNGRYTGQFCYVGEQGARINCADRNNLWQRLSADGSGHLLFEFINPYDGKPGVFRLLTLDASTLRWQLLSATEWLPLRVDLQRQ